MGLLGHTGDSSQSSASSSNAITASNSRLELIVPAPLGGQATFIAGSTIHPKVTLKGSNRHYTDLTLELRVETHATIQGKERWQAGQMLNASMGGPAVSINSQEILTVARVQARLLSPSRLDHAHDDDKKTKLHHEESGQGSAHLQGGLYELVIPDLYRESGQLLPSYPKRPLELCPVAVLYTLELVGKRQGMLKTNDRLSLELPVSVQLPPAGNHSITPNDWPFAEHSTPLKFQGKDGAALFVHAKLSHLPLTRLSDSIQFRLELTPSDPSVLHLLASTDTGLPSPKMSISLSRRVTTSPIDNPSKGQSNHTWGSIQIARPQPNLSSDQGGVPQAVEAQGGRWLWEGRVPVPKDEKTLESRGVSIRYSIGCQIISPAFQKSVFVVSMVVFLPSNEEDAPRLDVSEPGPRNITGDLPEYSA